MYANKYESPFSDIINFTTKCDKSKYTKDTCKGNYGPKGNINPTVNLKDRDTKTQKWPFFRIPNT